jgi:hypothetical protein
MNRRKYLSALGVAATGASAAVGTGAFTSVSADRSVSVQVASDSNAFLSLVPGDTGLVTESGGTLQVNLAGTGTAAEGVNFNAVTQIGSRENPEEDYAFKIVNQGTQSMMLKLNHYFTDTEWIGSRGSDQSFIRYTLIDTDGGRSVQAFPNTVKTRKEKSLGMPFGTSFGSSNYDRRFNVGEGFFVVITIDTTGATASLDDDLSGVVEITADKSTSQDTWKATDPPIE